MLFVPTEKPVIQNLNSYYLDIERLLEHYQGELSSGATYFRSPVAEAIVFFDESDIINVVFEDKEISLDGKRARDRLIDALENNNFSVSVYQIDPGRVFFWANLSRAEDFYRNLTAVSTDLEGLIRKMSSVKLTGYIEVAFDRLTESGLIFFNNGAIVGVASSEDRDRRNGLRKNLERLLRLSKQSGGIFHVKKIGLDKNREKGANGDTSPTIPPHLLTMIHEMLIAFELLVRKNNKIRTDFDTLLKKKFIEKADQYDFLDPFAAEFKFNSESVEFVGQASSDQLIKAVWESIKELAQSLDMLDSLRENLYNWGQQYSKEISAFGIDI